LNSDAEECLASIDPGLPGLLTMSEMQVPAATATATGGTPHPMHERRCDGAVVTLSPEAQQVHTTRHEPLLRSRIGGYDM